MRPAPLSASQGFNNFIGFTQVGSQNGSPPRHRNCGRRRRRCLTAARRPAHLDAMGDPKPLRLPRLVGEVLRTGQLPDDLVGALEDRFRVTVEEGGYLSSEILTGRGLHAFLGHLASGVEPYPGLERLYLLGVDREGTVHVLHSFFSVPVGCYSTERRLLDFNGELPRMDSLQWRISLWPPLQYSAPSAPPPREDHLVHAERMTSSIWQKSSYERTGKHIEDIKVLACRGLTFFTPDDASCLLGQGANSAEVSRLIPPLLASREPPYDKALDWIQFTYNGDRFGAYMAPTST